MTRIELLVKQVMQDLENLVKEVGKKSTIVALQRVAEENKVHVDKAVADLQGQWSSLWSSLSGKVLVNTNELDQLRQKVSGINERLVVLEVKLVAPAKTPNG